MLCSLALEYYPIAYWGVLDKAGDLLFPVLIDEDKGVVLGISGVIFVPSFPRVHQLFFFIADRNVERCGESFQEGLGSFVLPDVGFDGVSKGGDVGEVGDSIIFLVSDGEGDRLVMSCHRFDDGVHVFSDHVDVVISLWIILFVAEDRLADGDGTVDLRARRECSFENLDSDAFDLVRR